MRFRALGALTLSVLPLAACGSGPGAVKLATVRPCLSKLALVVVPKHPKGLVADTSPTRHEFASVSFGPEEPGATAANVSFFLNDSAVRENLVGLRKARASGIRFRGTAPRRVGKTILVSWSSPPSRRQVRAVTACLRNG